MVLGRMLVASCTGGRLAEVMLWPFGVFSTHTSHLSDRSHVCLCVGEITFLIPVLCVWWYMWKLTPECTWDFLDYDDDWEQCFTYNVASFGFMCTCFLLFFNLFVPVYPLHGSFAFVWMLNQCDLSLESMAKFVITGSMCAFVVFGGIAAIYRNWLSALVALFILWQSWSLWQHFTYHGLQFYPLFEDLYEVRKKSTVDKIKTVIGSSKFQQEARQAGKALVTAPYKPKRALEYQRGAYDDDTSGKKAFEAWLSGGKNGDDDSSETAPIKPKKQNRKVSFNPKVAQEVLSIDEVEEFDDHEYEGYEVVDDEEGLGAYDTI